MDSSISVAVMTRLPEQAALGDHDISAGPGSSANGTSTPRSPRPIMMPSHSSAYLLDVVDTGPVLDFGDDGDARRRRFPAESACRPATILPAGDKGGGHEVHAVLQCRTSNPACPARSGRPASCALPGKLMLFRSDSLAAGDQHLAVGSSVPVSARHLENDQPVVDQHPCRRALSSPASPA